MFEIASFRFATLVAGALAIAALDADTANAQTFSYAHEPSVSMIRSNLPPRDATNEQDAPTPQHLKRTVVAYATQEAPGTIVIDTANTYLYHVLGQGRAMRYGIGVGREGYTWSGVQTVSRKAEWPDWIPPAEMIARQPYLPRFVAGGPSNPLGARAMYLGSSIYRIHGTNDPTTIGHRVSSGCIRMTNEDVTDLFNRVTVGTKVVVLPTRQNPALDAYAAMPPREASVSANTQPLARRGITSGLY